MPTLLLVCEDFDHNPRWADVLARIVHDSTPAYRVCACDWQQASSTLESLRRHSEAPEWVILQTRYPEPWQWCFLHELLISLKTSSSQVVFWTASQRRPEALKSVVMGCGGFLPLLASEPELSALWQALLASGSLIPRRVPQVPQAHRRLADRPITLVVQPGLPHPRMYNGGRAIAGGPRGKPPLEPGRVMENLPDLHWASMGRLGLSPAVKTPPKPAWSLRQALPHAPGPSHAHWHPDALSPRKREVFEQMVDLYTYKEIGRDLGISAETVKDHASAILEASGCRSRIEVVARWAEWLRLLRDQSSDG